MRPNYTNVPPNCYDVRSSSGVDGTGIPQNMILRWSSAWTVPGGLPNSGNYMLGCAAHAG